MHAQTTQLRAVPAGAPGVPCTASEETALAQLNAAIAQKLAVGYRTPQVQLLQATVEVLTSAAGEDWCGLATSTAGAISVAHKVTSVTPYIFHNVTESSRILPSDHRLDLKKMLERRNVMRPPLCEIEAAKLSIQRCAIAAAISAEKGAIHIARQNLGAVFQRLHDCEALRSSIDWTPDLRAVLTRTRGNFYRAP